MNYLGSLWNHQGPFHVQDKSGRVCTGTAIMTHIEPAILGFERESKAETNKGLQLSMCSVQHLELTVPLLN